MGLELQNEKQKNVEISEKNGKEMFELENELNNLKKT